MRIYLYAAARWNLLKCALWCYISIRSKCVTMCCNSFASCQALWKKEKWNIFFPLSAETHARSCKTNSDSVMLKVICHVLCSPCGRLSGLGGAGCSELNHQVITVLCGPCRQQIRLRGSMICSWKSTPLKSKSILSERLPKDKVCCIIKKYSCLFVFVCVCVHVCWLGPCLWVCFLCPYIMLNIRNISTLKWRLLRLCVNRQPPSNQGLQDPGVTYLLGSECI